MDISKLRNAVQASEPRLLERLRALVEQESPSDDATAVARAGALVTGWAQALGGHAEEHPGGAFGPVLELWFHPEPGPTPGPKPNPRPNPEPTLQPAATSRPILLLGHLDTVWPLGTLRAMPWREESDRLLGPGVVDMKAGVVMALEALAALRAVGGLQQPVCLLLNPDEEVGSPVSRAHTERLALQSSAVFVLEPAQGLAYKTARKGVGHWELEVEGVAAHAGVDFTAGRSAILPVTALVQEVSAWTDLQRGLTVNVGTIAGGTRSNVVPAACRAEVDARVVTMADAAAIKARFAGLSVPEPFRLTVRGGINRPPMERGDGTVRLFRQAQAFAAELGFVLDEAATGGGSDGNFTAALGVPTLDGMGAVGGGAHAAHEHVLREHLVPRTALLAAMIAGAE